MSQNGYEEMLAPNVYFDRTLNMQAAKLLPGEYYATRRELVLVTTLGSCVAACIRDKTNGIGGMNHFMLPGDAQESGWGANSTRYGVYAMEMLINQLIKLGARRENMEAKVFGGGAVIKTISTINVGERNAKFCIDYLKTEGIPVVARDLLGIYPRKVYYFPETGRARVKTLRNLHNDTLFERELEYGTRLVSSKVEGEIELFT